MIKRWRFKVEDIVEALGAAAKIAERSAKSVLLLPDPAVPQLTEWGVKNNLWLELRIFLVL